MESSIDPRRLLVTLSLCLDFARQGFGRHHQQVTYIGLNLASEIGLSEEEKDLIFTAAIIHDAGASTWEERARLVNFEVDDPWDHCKNGFELVRQVDFLNRVAEIILSHHDSFGVENRSGRKGKNIPLAARVIHLADRVDVLLKQDQHILEQQDNISQKVADLAGKTFDPELVDVFMHLAKRESFWLDLTSPFLPHTQNSASSASTVGIDEDDLLQIAEMFAKVIDRKSAFTHRHSRGVARVASFLASAMGFGREEVTMMEVAGLLHDVGKLSIPDEILEKPAPLTREEFSVIKQHTYFTFHILQAAGVPNPIPEWAGHHHEKLDGSGYPFHLEAVQIPIGSRIMAVADIFTALHEDRPYRVGMKRGEIERIIHAMVADNGLDGEIVDVLFKEYNELSGLLHRMDN
jgi:putative nucleotidyltransferase with HDIG domain